MARKDITDLQVCLAYLEFAQSKNKWPYEILTSWTGECEKVCYSAMERAYNRDYIEYGVSLRVGWLTEKGNKLITMHRRANENRPV